MIKWDKVSDDILYISKEKDLEKYIVGDVRNKEYFIDTSRYQKVYFDSIDYQGKITFGSNIKNIYFGNNSSVMKTGQFELNTQADDVYIYLYNMNFSVPTFFKSQSKTHLVSFGKKCYLW